MTQAPVLPVDAGDTSGEPELAQPQEPEEPVSQQIDAG